MASWKEIEEFKRDPARARALAKSLLVTTGWTAWEEPFLEDMQARHERLSTRQAEKLLEIRDDAQWVSSIKGFSVRTLLQTCWEARFDLDNDDDIEFLERLKANSSTTAKYRDASRLLRCARKLQMIDA
jgi:hypothetical protein